LQLAAVVARLVELVDLMELVRLVPLLVDPQEPDRTDKAGVAGMADQECTADSDSAASVLVDNPEPDTASSPLEAVHLLALDTAQRAESVDLDTGRIADLVDVGTAGSVVRLELDDDKALDFDRAG